MKTGLHITRTLINTGIAFATATGAGLLILAALLFAFNHKRTD